MFEKPHTSTMPILSLKGVNKAYGAIKALTDVSLDLYPGQVVALVGDNGAGKSTLVKCLSGVVRIDSGEYMFEGRKVSLNRPSDANAIGIQTVYQDLALCSNLDAVQNLFLGRELAGPWWTGFRLRRAECERRAKEVLRRLRLDSISLTRNVGAMSGGQQQNIAIARSILWHPKVVLLDEPTAALSVSAAKEVGNLIRDLAAQNLAVLVISHDIHNFVIDHTDHIEVLRLGRNVGRYKSSDVTGEHIVNAMVGGDAGVNSAG